jgi:hypothetical protein
MIKNVIAVLSMGTVHCMRTLHVVPLPTLAAGNFRCRAKYIQTPLDRKLTSNFADFEQNDSSENTCMLAHGIQSIDFTETLSIR